MEPEKDLVFVLDWQVENVAAFVDAANELSSSQAPVWLRTFPPNMTPSSFVDDVMYSLQTVAGGRWGNVLLAPNTLSQFTGIFVILLGIQDDFLLEAMERALPVATNADKYLARTYFFSKLEPQPQTHLLRNLRSTRRLFI